MQLSKIKGSGQETAAAQADPPPGQRGSELKPVFCFYPASARYFRVAAGRSCQIFMAIIIPISANGIRKYGQ
jgi:hypothetical protein